MSLHKCTDSPEPLLLIFTKYDVDDVSDQCNPFITLCSGNVSYGIETILQSDYRKMTIKWSFSYNCFVKFCGEKFGCHSMTMLYPNPCYINVCYKGTALYNPMSCTKL